MSQSLVPAMSFLQTVLSRYKFWTPSLAGKPSSISDNVKYSYEELTLGVWRILVMKDSFSLMFNFQWANLFTRVTFFLHVLHDIYTISPRLFALCIVAQFWFAIENPLGLYLSNWLFCCIEKRISGRSSGDPTPSALYLAVIFRVACSAISAYMKWSSRQNRQAYASRVKYEYQARVFSAKLNCDLQTAQETDESRVDADDVFICLERGITLVNEVISCVLHLRFIIHVVGSGFRDGGPVFLALCMLPFTKYFSTDELWTRAYVVSAANKFFIRKSALEKISTAELRQEVMAGGVNEYLMREYRMAKDGLGDTSDTVPEMLHTQKREALSGIIMSLCSDGPMLYFALLALFCLSKLSIVQLAVLDQTSTSLRYTFASMRFSIGLWPSEFSRMMNIYSVLHAKNMMQDGEMPFPRPGSEASEGTSIQLHDVSFSYPNTKSDRSALTGVSFTIRPGQLVVIVGANGSEKSTVIKLLSRFYDPTSGTILIDGIPIKEYRMDQLRKGIAMLAQEHKLFPLSVRENIQLGSSEAEAITDEGKIGASVLAVSADGVLKSFSNGYDTVLEPVTKGDQQVFQVMCTEQLADYLFSTWVLTGGEKQKLVAARTFMRLFTSPVKLVTVDEPSSALDPEAEYQLFANLRQQRKGRTMIFVTHRFGHLTKYADLIICVKEGTVVETGTHTDLLSKGGEYARLYDVQAQAFAAP